jgi:hypothetical protein
MLIVAVVVVVAKNDNSLKANADLFSEDEAKQLFTNWCDEVGRIYYTKEEYSLRFKIASGKLLNGSPTKRTKVFHVASPVSHP